MGNPNVLLACHGGRSNLMTRKRLASRQKQRILYGITLVEVSGSPPRTQLIETSCPFLGSQEELRSLPSRCTHFVIPSPRLIRTKVSRLVGDGPGTNLYSREQNAAPPNRRHPHYPDFMTVNTETSHGRKIQATITQ